MSRTDARAPTAAAHYRDVHIESMSNSVYIDIHIHSDICVFEYMWVYIVEHRSKCAKDCGIRIDELRQRSGVNIDIDI